jgi:hypothetical protein
MLYASAVCDTPAGTVSPTRENMAIINVVLVVLETIMCNLVQIYYL